MACKWFAAAWALSLVAPALGQREAERLRVAAVVWEGAELIEFVGPLQVFALAPGFDEFTVGAGRRPVRTGFCTVTPEFTFADCPPPDVIVLPGGMSALGDAALKAWLVEAAARATVVLTVCNGAVIAANAGLLDGVAATAPPGHLDELMIFGRDVQACANRRFQDSGKMVTADSYFAGLDAALHVVSRLRGADAARETAERGRYDWRPEAYAALHAEPGEVRETLRYRVYRALREQDVAAALEVYRAGCIEPPTDGGPPVTAAQHEDRFTYLAWNLLTAGRVAEAQQMCAFLVAAFPESSRARACLGEAQFHAGRIRDALEHLLAAAEMTPPSPHAATVLWRVLMTPEPAAAGAAGTAPISAADSQRAREIIRAAARAARVQIVPEGEAGDPMVVSGTVRDTTGRPIVGALVYVYQTDAQGYYSRGLVAAPNGRHDDRHARLFGYLRTDADGRYEFRTIRPAAYADAPDNPQHIHYGLRAEGYVRVPRGSLANLYFADDPRLVGAHLAELKADGAGIIAPTRDPDGTQRVVYDLVMERE